MLPSDHFVKFYNEIFKYLERKGPKELDRYYERVAERQAFFTLDAFKSDGFKGMYDYWDRIRIEENCDLTHGFDENCYHLKMNVCPSLSKVTGNDAGHCRCYCDHCPGWVGRVLARAGYFMVYDIVGRESPECGFWVFRTKEEAESKRRELLASRDEDLVVTNYLTNEKEK